jgi:phenylacetate-coenzyme A ligase PaaK-like adenylate-forming protein
MILAKTPLEEWIKDKIGFPSNEPLTGEALIRYQITQLRQTLKYVQEHSPFYRSRMAGLSPVGLSRLEDLTQWPLTTAEDIRRDPLAFLCVSHSEVSRAVTLPSLNASEGPKRIFFTKADLDLTVDFFHHGMSALVAPGQRVLILLPGRQPDSVGDLLVRGLARMNVEGVVQGPVQDPLETIRAILDLDIDCLVGIPIQVLTLVRHPKSRTVPKGRLKSVLLSTDYVARSIAAEINQVWGCPVYSHYGTTEMGYGGGVTCAALNGYHLREADLLFEIIDPDSGQPVPLGWPGEVVFTTLTRQAMPLIRFRTGDLTAFITEPCPCGSVLKRLDEIQGRYENLIILASNGILGIAALDEAVLAVSEVLHYQAEILFREGRELLQLTVVTKTENIKRVVSDVQKAVKGLAPVADALSQGQLKIDIGCRSDDPWFTTGVAKRTILDRRGLKHS